ncbi:MAG: redoxin domain-containing protein [Planctomycetota bacterium]
MRFEAGEASGGGSEVAAGEQDSPSLGLLLGSKAPDAELLDVRGETISLASLYQSGPVILVFYRGGWCTYCNQTLAAWADRSADVAAAGARVVALSPESPEHGGDTSEAHGGVLILSDARHEAAERFRVVDELGTLDRVGYSLGGIELDEWNESGDWKLPAAATFVVDRVGVVRYRYATLDHTSRADPDDVLQAVRGLTAASPTPYP